MAGARESGGSCPAHQSASGRPAGHAHARTDFHHHAGAEGDHRIGEPEERAASCCCHLYEFNEATLPLPRHGEKEKLLPGLFYCVRHSTPIPPSVGRLSS